jgi:hypothetical protein
VAPGAAEVPETEGAQVIHRLVAIIALALICAGIIVLVNIHEIAPALSMLDGGGHP